MCWVRRGQLSNKDPWRLPICVLLLAILNSCHLPLYRVWPLQDPVELCENCYNCEVWRMYKSPCLLALRSAPLSFRHGPWCLVPGGVKLLGARACALYMVGVALRFFFKQRKAPGGRWLDLWCGWLPAIWQMRKRKKMVSANRSSSYRTWALSSKHSKDHDSYMCEVFNAVWGLVMTVRALFSGGKIRACSSILKPFSPISATAWYMYRMTA